MADIRECDIIATLQELREEFGLTEAEMKQFEAAELTTGASALRAVGYSLSTTASIVEARGKVTRIPVTFTAKLPGAKQVAVKQMYPDFEITFTQATTRAHAMAACCRMLDRQVLKKRSPPGMGIVSVGGNYEYELLTSDTVVHSCTPEHRLVADCKEAARDVQRMGRLRGIAAGRGDYSDKVRARVSRFLESPDDWRCAKLAQDCHHQAGVMLMAHVYDMKLEQVVQAMISHGASLVLGCVLLTNEMLISDSGTLPSVDGYFQKDGADIKYGFVGEQQWEYSHSWAELRRYAFSGAVVQCGARQAFYTITERRGDTIFFSLALMPVTVPSVPLRVSWKANDRKRAVVNGYKLSDVNRTTVKKALVPAVFSYPYDPFIKALAYAIERVEKGSFSLEDLQRKTRAIFADTTLNAVRISGQDKLEDDQLAYFLANVGVLAVLSVNRSAVEETVYLSGVKMIRGGLTDGTLTKAAKALSALWHQPFSNSSAVHRTWRSIVEFLYTSTGSAMLRGVSWSIDMGYRTAHEVNRGKSVDAVGSVSVPGYNGSGGTPFERDLLATLVSAAADSDDMALVLAETAATISPHPVIEEWATALRAKFDKSVNTEARKIERSRAQLRSDPEVGHMVELSDTDDPKVAELSDAMSTLVNTMSLDEARAIEADSADLTLPPREMAEALGVTLDPRDEVTTHHVEAEELNYVANNAILESIALLEIEEEKKTDECIVIYSRVIDAQSNPDPVKMRAEMNLNFNVDFWQTGPTGLLEHISMRKVRQPKTERYFFAAAVFIPSAGVIVRTKSVPATEDGQRVWYHRVNLPDGTPYHGTCMTTSFLHIYNGPVILSNMRQALDKPLRHGTRLTFVEGVPGCGKTHYIIHAARPTSVVIACGRENAAATRERMQELAMEREEAGLTDLVMTDVPFRVRTLDSALMFPPVNSPVVDTMFLDECFQDHAGKFWACVKIWNPRSIQALGDRQQIPFIDRNQTGKCHVPMLSHWHLRVGKYVSYRCPRDAVAAIARYYDFKIRTNSQITTSMQVKKFEPNNLVYDKDYKYLVMYQVDKLELLKRGFRDVNTIGEVQGQTYEKVALVKLQTRVLSLFSDKHQVDVALSRHTKEFIYYVPDSLPDSVRTFVTDVAKDISLVDKYGDTATAGIRIHDV